MLNRKALDVIMAVQSLGEFKTCDRAITPDSPDDTRELCREYYLRIPDQVMSERVFANYI